MIKFASLLNLSGSRIDRANGVIKGVSLISLGEARGHDKHVDQQTLKSVIECAKQYGDGLRVKFNPKTFAHGDAGLGGFIPPSSLRIEGGKAVGDVHLYKHFPSDDKEYLYEIVERTPGNIGLSIEFTGDDETIDGQKFARCDEIYAATIVDMPAANPTGFFSVREFQNLTTHQQKLNPNAESTLMKPEELKQLVESNEFKSAIKTIFAECMPEKPQADKDKEEMAAAGVTDKDDDKTKQEKLSTFRAGNKKISDMTAGEFAGVIGQANMQFFRQTGGKPVKIAPADGDETGGDPFESRMQKFMEAGAGKAKAINLARQAAPKEYNAWMSKKHPNVQHMAKK